MTIYFDQPGMLALSLLVLPLAALGWWALRDADALRRGTALAARALLVVALAVTLARPHVAREHDHLTVIGLLDISGSVQRFARLPDAEGARRSYVQQLREWFREATRTRAPDDRFGLVVFDGEAIAVSAPTRADTEGDAMVAMAVPGTNIEDAIRLGLAMFPAETARRLVLVTDGNETLGDAVAAAREAAGRARASGPDGEEGSLELRSVPIDVLPIDYRVEGDVQIVRVEAPPSAQPGQTVTVRVIMEATRPARGLLTLRREGLPVDLNGAVPGQSRRISVPAGRSVQLATVTLGETPVNRFEAIFEPEAGGADALADNNRARAFTSTPGKGRILILDSLAGERPNTLERILRDADLPARTEPPGRFPTDLLSLQNYDLIVLDNVPSYDLNTAQHALISRYVNDLGGGLIMLGGENSFGAGGWNGTAVEDVLPLELDPSKEMRLPEAALVLVLDQSGSMNRPVAGARATQQEVANEAAALAIESLRAESLIGVVTFHAFSTEYVPIQPNDDPKAIANRVRRITANGGTDLAPALRRAHAMLRGVQADRKRVVCLTDGQSPTEHLDGIVQGMVADNIKLTTIAVGDDADHTTLLRLAEIGGGEFYPVYNPQALPRVLVDSVQIINKPLIKEVPFAPVVQPTGSTLTLGLDTAPPLGGLVVTAPRPDPRAVVEASHPDGEPLLAQWQAGLGRVAAFTSDVGGSWSRTWDDWPGAAPFLTQLARTVSRPAVSHEAELLTELRDGRLHITLEAVDRSEGFLDYLHVAGTVYAPEGDPIAVRLPQTAPGRYETSVPARDAGNYIVALNPRRGTRQLAPVIGGASRTTGEEFRRYESNLDLVERIAMVTGGRRLELAAPEEADLYDRAGMPVSVAVLPVWSTVLWIVLGLLLLDVATRRIAWSSAAVRALIARAVARVAPAHVKGSEAAATLASLREVSTQLDGRVEADAREVKRLKPRPPVEPPKRDLGKVGPPEPSKVAAALSALLGRPAPGRKEPEPEPETKAPEAEEDEDRAASTASLLAAKRRVRKQLDQND